jgi:hypothetical protein
MDPFFLPLPVLYPYPPESSDTLTQLEQYLDVALCLLRKTVERLQTALGPEALGPELSRFLAGNDPIEQSMASSQLDTLVKQKKEREAVKLIHDQFGVTWDQAFKVYSCWSWWDRGRKLRCLQAVELRRLFASFNDSIQEESTDGNHRESAADRCESA